MLANNQQATASAGIPERDCGDTFEALAQLCKASGDSLRLLVLRVLQQDSFGVMELCSIFDLRQPALSHHLKVLNRAGVVTSRREGNSIFYRRALPGQHPELALLHRGLFETIDKLQLPRDIAVRLEQLQQQREKSSSEFFRQNADKFRAQQDLIASYQQYAETVRQVLAEAPLQNRALALEVGPGDGAFLATLSPGFKRVIALDNSREMLEQAQALVTEQKLGNVEFIHGDTRHAALEPVQADCIVVNMVLHHTPAPADILSDLAACLAPTGVLLVTDLCQHDQGWAREACGDLWLGFDPADLQAWAQAAGLKELASAYLAQRNGFQIQVRLFGGA